jgi:predicted thioesterase
MYQGKNDGILAGDAARIFPLNSFHFGEMSMADIVPGLTHENHYVVEEKHTARHLGSGGVPVLATPTIILWMEETSRGVVEPLLPQGQMTVGSHLDVRHLAPTPVGMKVTVRSELLAVEGRKLTFRVEAHDEREKVSAGTHERFIIDLEKFKQRVAGKK